ncbi:MAG: PEP-CTERM sorting domain-containing protein, partial [Phycisphaerae bacterium]|nr:PEP-CTERM sorting domain-containing protein [Phycisphaerae bacterium]
KSKNLIWRRIMKKLITICLVVFFAINANAVMITHTHSQGIGSYDVSFNSGGSYTSSYLGRFVMSVATSTTLPANYPVYTYSDHPYSFYSYCLEPTQSIAVGHTATYDFTIGSLAGTDGISAPEAVLINELFGRYSPLLSADPTGNYTGGTFRTAAAALQLAIWKINLDAATETLGLWDFTSGLMRVGTITAESGASKTANVVALEMLNSLTGTGPMAWGLEGLRSTSTQDLLIQSIPEPATIAILGLGALSLVRRKK